MGIEQNKGDIKEKNKVRKLIVDSSGNGAICMALTGTSVARFPHSVSSYMPLFASVLIIVWCNWNSGNINTHI